MLTADDDELHAPRQSDPSWAETAWFSASIPERGIGIWTYPFFRPTLGVMSCAVVVWGPDGRELWQQPYHRLYWHMPIPAGLRLSGFELPNGLGYRMREPLNAYEITYTDGDEISLELTFTGIHPAHAFGVEEGRGHIDQLGRVQGEVSLHGERLEVDCISMRDRTWSPRREERNSTWVGYSYGAVSDREAFHCATRLERDGEVRLMTGFALRDAEVEELVAGARHVVRDRDGRPSGITISGRDRRGASVEAKGEVVSQTAFLTSPYFVWVSLVRWTLSNGAVGWGEDQETWSPAMLRALRRGAISDVR
jgi:hypothetical protein